MKINITLILILCMLVFTGCKQPADTMVLLDEKIEIINISNSHGFGEMNEDIIYSFRDIESISILKDVITTATKQKSDVDVEQPDFDMMIGYGDEFPIHAIHLWLGKEGETSTFRYMVDDEVSTYVTTPNSTNKLRSILN
ncbi:hypothetical protein ACFSTA_09955 [Ornithinibacillus salinisoli]|uniref:YhfM-like domain-containing protein n=2 Tax=Ornithinibacillus salinisoli TaxID=1848459 RepID=A0ABW4VX45_9BACI